MTSENTPIVNQGTKYVTGLMLNWISNTSITVNVGMARSQVDLNDIILGDVNDPTLAVGSVIDATKVGVNGIDKGVLTANSDYSVYIIGDSTKYKPTACIISLSFNSVINYPLGYDMCRRIGLLVTDGSANIRKFYQYGRSLDRKYYYDVPVSVLSGGSATTFTAINLGIPLPYSGPYEVYCLASYTPALAVNAAEFLPGTSTATSGIVKFGGGSTANQNGNILVPATAVGGVPEILYKVAAGDLLSLSVVGFTDYLSAPQ